ncbi:hypothetical protein COEREDRAFT_6947 [Coemansia reversa NRRL 1564]|uniref:G-patch domain-containing protein n=1 Tax=Coemansia reversa (strain ATCC 12441 / NRRL 1564) TaxID=763665 RepID=A0A2G5BGT8_COERN|nr:hypothetical protein COEREDRAFT_6947 [Coemansia reversa NRRL 1564]|eukprot:PIA18213.1 hypothetical protein COEREDRAFT_6947 [Coemansia reversa NRRL 1564]
MYEHRTAFGFSDSSDDDVADHASHSLRGRRHAKISKDAQMLGIWATDDENNLTATTGAADLRSSSAVDTSNPLDFVTEQEHSKQGHAAGPESVSEGEQQSDFFSDANGTTSASETSTSTRSEPALSNGDGHTLVSRDLLPPPSKDFGKFASSAVWGMMAKMGYRHGEGLGKHGEGRVEPVQVKLRRAGEGISFSGSEVPPDHPKVSLPLRSASTRRARDASTASAAINTSSVSRKIQSTTRRKKTEYKTLEEIELRTDSKLKELFVDMRSNTEAGSLTELLAATMPHTEREKLVSDARLGLDLAFGRLEDLVRERDAEVAKSKALHSEVASLKRCVAARSVRIEGLHAIEEAIAVVYSASRDVPRIEDIGSATEKLEVLYSSFGSMRSAANKVTKRCGFDIWGELQLERVVTDSIHTHFAHLFRAWDPTTHPGLTASLTTPLLPFVCFTTSSNDALPETMTPFESLLSNSLVPRLKQYIYTEWDSSTDSLSTTFACLPPVVVAEISATLAASLQRSVEAVNPRLAVERYKLAATLGTNARRSLLAVLRFDHTVIPWLPFISDPTELLVCVRRKLSTAIDCWSLSKDSNEDIILLLAPWMDVLRGKELRRLANNAADLLHTLLRSEFVFNARKQTLWPFKALLKWRHSMPLDIWLSLVRRTILQDFLDYLRRWLEDRNSNYAEIADWYWQWKLMYPTDVRDSPDIQDAFKTALVYMAYALSQK